MARNATQTATATVPPLAVGKPDAKAPVIQSNAADTLAPYKAIAKRLGKEKGVGSQSEGNMALDVIATGAHEKAFSFDKIEELLTDWKLADDSGAGHKSKPWGKDTMTSKKSAFGAFYTLGQKPFGLALLGRAKTIVLENGGKLFPQLSKVCTKANKTGKDMTAKEIEDCINAVKGKSWRAEMKKYGDSVETKRDSKIAENWPDEVKAAMVALEKAIETALARKKAE